MRTHRTKFWTLILIILSITAASHADLRAIRDSIRESPPATPEQASALADELADAIANASIDEEAALGDAYQELINLHQMLDQPELALKTANDYCIFVEQTTQPLGWFQHRVAYHSGYLIALLEPTVTASEGLNFLARLQAFYESYQGPEDLTSLWTKLNESRAKLFEQKANQTSRRLGGESAVGNNPNAASLVASLMAQSTDYMRKYADTLIEYQMPVTDIENALSKTGVLATKTAELYEVSGNLEQVITYQAIGQMAFNDLLTMVSDGDLSELSGQDMARMFKLAFDSEENADQIGDLIHELIALGMPSENNKGLASRVEMAGYALEHKNPHKARAMFDLILDLEQAWYPDDYLTRDIYHQGLIYGVRTSLEIGDLEEAIWRLNALHEVANFSPVVREFIAGLNDQTVRATLDGTNGRPDIASTSLDPSGWVPERNWASQANSQTQPTSTVESTPSPTPANVESPAANQFTETSATAAIQIEEDSDFGWWITIAIIVLLAIIGISIARRV